MQYDYNALGEQTKITDPHGNAETTSWDMLGNKISDSDPDRGLESYQYDRAGNLLRSRDARGRTITYTYDALERLHTKTDQATHQTSTWTYDNKVGSNAGRLVSISDPSASGCPGRLSHTYSYDLLGDPTRETSCAEGLTGTTSMTFNAFGQVVRTTYPDGLVVKASYNSAGQLTSLSGYVRSITYTPQGQVATEQFANGTTATNTYDPRRETLTRQTLTTTSGKHTLLFAESYGYDAAGHITTRTSSTNGENHHYAYNILSELTTVRTGKPAKVSQQLTYDDLGNLRSNSAVGGYDYPATRTCTDAGCSGPQEAQTVGNRSYSYDKSGDVTREQQGKQLTTLSWTSDGMLAQLHTSGDTVTRTYDANDTLVSEHDKDGTTVVSNGLAQHSAAGWTDDLYAGSSLIATHSHAGATWYAIDDQSSTRALVNQTGKVIARSNYGTFGSRLAPDPGARYGYTGAQAIGSSAFLDLTARDYDPSTGRFLSADAETVSDAPIGANRYAYSLNDPATLNDPTGHDPLLQGTVPSWATITPNGGFDSFTGLSTETLPASQWDPVDIVTGEVTVPVDTPLALIFIENTTEPYDPGLGSGFDLVSGNPSDGADQPGTGGSGDAGTGGSGDAGTDGMGAVDVAGAEGAYDTPPTDSQDESDESGHETPPIDEPVQPRATQGGELKRGTLQVGVSLSGSALVHSVGLQVGIALDRNGGMGFYYQLTGASLASISSLGLDANAGISVAISNALVVGDLTDTFLAASAGGGFMGHWTVDAFAGPSAHGPVVGVGVTGGIGAGGFFTVGPSYTGMSTPGDILSWVVNFAAKVTTPLETQLSEGWSHAW